MTPAELARAFVEAFCAGDIGEMAETLHEAVRLEGPWAHYDNRKDYLRALDGDLAADPNAEIHSVVAQGNEAAAFYRYRGRWIAQWFRCADGRITESRIVFDTAAGSTA